MSNNKLLWAMAPLFLVIFIDGMGLGLLFPILNSIIVDPASAFLAVTTSAGTRNFLYGLTIGIFMICWFFGAAMLGDLSDNIGRKKSLLICLFGSALGYLISAMSIFMHSLLFLILGRIIAGFTAGSQPIAQAAIIDVSTDEHKARNIGFILLAASLGFVFGPIIGGVLSNARFASWFTFATPLYFAALISLVNAILLWILFAESFRISSKVKVKFSHAIHIFASAFQHKKIRWLSLVLLVMIFGWGNYFSFISMFMLDRYAFTPFKIAMFLAVLGVGFSIGCGFLVDYCAKKFSLKYSIIGGLTIAAICTTVTLLTHKEIDTWICVLIIGIAIAVAYSIILVILSNQVGETEQGWVMGVSGSIMALCFGIATFLTGIVSAFGTTLPLILAVIGLLLSALLMLMFREEKELPVAVEAS